MSFAKVVVSGTLQSDPEKRFTPNNHAVTSFTLAVPSSDKGGRNAQGPSEPQPVKITCWRNLAEAVTTLKKGDAVVVEGKLMMNSFQTQEGVAKKLFEVEAVSINQLPGGEPQPVIAEGESGGASAPRANSYAQQPAPQARPVAAATTANNPGTGHFSSEDLMGSPDVMEEDIPF